MILSSPPKSAVLIFILVDCGGIGAGVGGGVLAIGLGVVIEVVVGVPDTAGPWLRIGVTAGT